MKKILIISFISSLVVTSVFGGITFLTYTNHALLPNNPNEMVLTEFIDPGMSGANQVWNFSGLKKLNDFHGTIKVPDATHLKSAFFSNQFNTELKEFDNSFFFNITKEKIEMTGYRSSNGNVEINYDKPYVKMVYPFEYGNSINGNYSGIIKSNNLTGEISGIYDVVADGYGKLILPNNLEIDNTLRVKTILKYKQAYGSSNASEITITTYRWYTQNVRYPLLVLIKSEYGNGGTSYQAAYKSSIEQMNYQTTVNAGNISAYPNPFSEKLNVSYELTRDANVTVEIYDITGKKVSVLMDEKKASGLYDEDFKVNDLGLKNGLYNIRVTVDGTEQNFKLLKMN